MKKAVLAVMLFALPALAAVPVPLTEPAQQNPPKDVKAWWPEFLGPRRDGIVHEKGLNTDWKKTPPKVLWKVPLGEGFSSFAIVGERAFTMCKRGQYDILVCLDTKNGKELWTHELAASYIDKQEQGAGPRSTPTYHDGKLYCLMPRGDLVCVSAADGKRVWAANQFKDTGAASLEGEYFYWGVSVSPLVEGDLVIVQPGGKNNNSIAAFHKNTGKLVWKVGDDSMGYASPLAVTIAGQRLLIVPTGNAVMGLAPATGKVLWRYDFGTGFTCSTPVWVDGLLWMSAAYDTGGALLDITTKADKWTVKEIWKNKKSLQTLYTSAMIVDGHIYGCHGDTVNLLKCVELKTGKVMWSERLDESNWLLAIDGHLLCWGESGSLKLVESQATQYVEKAELPDLLGEQCWAAPALADGRLYLRDVEHALCLDLRKQ
ncbi:MAG TPA: PQQ-binding-like beta-propeller repeat protein [Gemmataceae bacterium]|nr:PQQ-binding-like beta-propeller repeat protein [Gemmataceae bacterium]